MIKKIIYLSFTALIISCSSDDKVNLDISKVYGKWYQRNYCEEQNHISFNEDNTYISFSSGNNDCSNSEMDTVKVTGVYRIDGNDIEFTEETYEIVIEGSIPGDPVSIETFKIYRKIIELTDESMIIEYKYKDYEGAPEEKTFILDLYKVSN